MPNITNKDCERAVEKQIKLFDERCSGLYVSVTPKGAVFNFKYFDRRLQKQRTVEVGPYVKGKFTVVEARIKGDGFRSRAAGGESLVETMRKKEIEAKREGKTVDEIITAYVEWIKTLVQKADGEMRPRIESWKGTEGYLMRFTSRALGTRSGSSIENDDIAAVSNDIVAGKYGKASTSNARQFRTTTSAMFNWAAEAGRRYVKNNPCHHLPALDPEQSRTRVLTKEEIKTLWWGLDHPGVPCSREIALGLKLELVTMLRTKEFLTGLTSELVGRGTPDAQFQIPARRVKKRRIIVCPLSDLAQELIDEAILNEDQEYILCGRFDGEPLSDKALAQALRTKRNKKGKVLRLGIREFLGMEHFTPHDLRRTAATLAGDLGFDERIISKCLDHNKETEQDAVPTVTGVYVRSKFLGKKREVLDGLAKALREIVGPSPRASRLTLVA